MQTYKNELSVTRGETFTIDKYFVNKDGSPYIVSNKLNNPYWLLSVSDTVYSQQDRYVKNYWLPVNTPRFNSTIAIALTDIKVDAAGTASKYTKFADITSFPIVGYIDGVTVSFDDGTDSVFYEEDADGNRIYKYWNGTQWEDYSCRLVKTFLQSDTKEWTSKSYLYSIQLVSGVDMYECLRNFAIDIGLPITDTMSNKDIYECLLEKGVKFPANLDFEQALGAIDTAYLILEPTRIKVTDNTQGDILW